MQGLESRRIDSHLFKFSILITGLMCFLLGVLELVLAPKQISLATFHITGGVLYLGIGIFGSRLIRFEAMLAFLIAVGVPYLAYGILFTNGLSGSSSVWFTIFPVYALLFSKSGKMRILYFVYTIAGMGTVLFCEIFWRDYFAQIHAQFPLTVSWVLTLFGLIAIASHVYLYEVKRRRMSQIVGRQGRWLENSRRLAVAGTLAGSIAHEINTPLATIHMVAQATAEKLEPGAPNGQLREQMELILRIVGHINKTVRSLLNFSRRKAGEALAHQDLQALLDEISILTKMRFQRHGVEFRLNVQDVAGLTIYCRPYEISQALIVMLNNSVDAVSALPERWVELKVSQNDDHCEFEVIDSGPGIPPEIWDKIFDPYFTTKDEGQGTGLGLAVASQFAEDHGGKLIYLRHKSNTTFRMTIPNAPGRYQNEKAAIS